MPGYKNAEENGSKYEIPIDGSLCSQGNTCNDGVETACPAGKYCGDLGLSEPTDDCLAGYFCSSGAKYRMMVHETMGNADGVTKCSQS